MSTVLVLALGALCGGFVNGLAGFGTGLTALGFWLHVVSPTSPPWSVLWPGRSSPSTKRRAVAWQRAWPFLVGGVLGVPFGVAALRVIEPRTLKGPRVLLVGYAGLTLALRRFPTVSGGGRVAATPSRHVRSMTPS